MVRFFWYKRYTKTNKKCDVDNLLLEHEEEDNKDELVGNDPGTTATSSKLVKKRTQARIIYLVRVVLMKYTHLKITSYSETMTVQM